VEKELGPEPVQEQTVQHILRQIQSLAVPHTVVLGVVGNHLLLVFKKEEGLVLGQIAAHILRQTLGVQPEQAPLVEPAARRLLLDEPAQLQP
jgi:hypothetical protein